jgi:hypothetical protein
LVDSAAGRSQTLQTRDCLFTGFSRQRVPWAPDGQSFCLADLWETVGATTSIVSPEAGQVKGWKKTDWGDEPVDMPEENAKPDDSLVLRVGRGPAERMRGLTST